MKSVSFTSRALALVLIGAVQMLVAPASAGSPAATLSGEIVSASARAPVAGVVVHVVNPGTGDLYTSGPTDDKGSFEFRALPAATYSVAVQRGNGVFRTASPILLAPGQHRSVQVALYEQEAAPSPAEVEPNPYKMSPWENPLTATLIALGIAVVVGYAVQELIGDDDNKKQPPVASPMLP
jgi:hypothetical protein